MFKTHSFTKDQSNAYKANIAAIQSDYTLEAIELNGGFEVNYIDEQNRAYKATGKTRKDAMRAAIINILTHRPRRYWRTEVVKKVKPALFKCLQCGKGFKTTAAAERAMNRGCPQCGASDVDLA